MKFSELNVLQDTSPEATTCAVAIFTTEQPTRVLLVHPNGAGYAGAWSLPKGLRDEGETDADAARREVREETGVDLKEAKLTDHGVHAYLKHKKYHLFSIELNSTLDTKAMKCETTFERDGRQIVEVDKFMWADHKLAMTLLNKRQAAIFGSTFK